MKERLFKKNVLNKTTVEHVSWTCCSMFHLQCMLHSSSVVHSKKKKSMRFISCDISLQACGGWAGSSQNCGCRIFIFSLPTSFPTPLFPNFVDGKIQCLGEDPTFGSNRMVGCPPIRNINGWFHMDETLDIKLCPIEFPNLLREKRSELYNGSC